ncbi:MAG TPA: xanthine dehydrogenase family protein subunit M [Hyphomicrobiaceae bacterium]|nr:xanthine dehydrogenase family protein subunit M [Hyphomicrobiaceae bacterium]
MYAFDYSRPTSVADAARALETSPGARLMAGGQTLIPTMKQRLAQPPTVIDLGGVGELRGIHRDGRALGIGAMTTHAEVATSKDVREAIPALAYLASCIGDPAVRHSGTLGGSIANNDPAADYPAAILGLGATVVTNKRTIASDVYFKGLFETSLEGHEIVTAVGFAVPKRAGYAKFEQRASRYALVGVFVAETDGAWRVAVTGAGAKGVFRATDIEKALASGAAPGSVKIASAGLISDLHGSAEYRAALIPVMAERALAAAK